jgi:hypothetical protein
LERRAFLCSHGKYKITHLARRRRTFLNVVGTQRIAHSLLQAGGAHSSHLQELRSRNFLCRANAAEHHQR